MKLHFESNLGYQLDAIEAVCDLFRGQEICRTEFTVTLPRDPNSLFEENSDLGIGNRLQLLDTELLANLREVQLRHGLKPTDELESGKFNFTVEMETGTGKTYVYLRTIFQLNRDYGFTKFVIVVPSVAIKEGVFKTLEITEDHLRSLYGNVPFSKGNNYFIYDSSKLGQVRNFATSSQLQVMVVTVGAINKKDVNNLYKSHEAISDEKPIDLIRATRPIIIVDEPQSVDGGLEGRGREALDGMNPLCTVRYSATHIDKHAMVYRLDAVDAYQQKLVKQIEVASLEVEGGHNKPFVRVKGIKPMKGKPPVATLELDIQQAKTVSRKEKKVSGGEDLEQLTNRAIYSNFRIGEINAKKGQEYVEIHAPGDHHFLKIGETTGDVDQTALKRQMIRRTIKEHLDKELRLRPQGIKVLSLFFIDEVGKYRIYDVDGNPQKGEYAHIFEEEYAKLVKHPNYRILFEGIDATSTATEVHDGYFSIDKKGTWQDTAENNSGNRENAERAYNLIMREKEKLLSFDTKLKFIFSHSALREGWDNPNVFQICALRDIGTERERRQTIGRGLRLCVNSSGDRIRGFETNTLTVIATESYEEFAEQLQKEIETDTGIKFGIVEEHQFATIAVPDGKGSHQMLGYDKSKEIWGYLQKMGYLDKKGKVQDRLRTDLKAGMVELPEEFAPYSHTINDILRKLAGKLDIKNADERKTIRTRQAVLESEAFKALWDRIKHKTTYRVHFDAEKLITDAAKAIANGPPISKSRLHFRKAELDINKGGVAAKATEVLSPTTLDEDDIDLPDILTDLQDKTQLTRKSIARILTKSGRLKDFRANPQQFIEQAVLHINYAKRLALVDGIRYRKLGDEHYFTQELFETEELTGYLKNMIETSKGTHECVVYQSGVEKSFAEDLENNVAVKVYAKLPNWFRVPTPLGFYEPDWAVLIEEEGKERLYFVVETKSSLFDFDLRDREQGKIDCGKAHFEEIGSGFDQPAKFVMATELDDVFQHVH
ncbi:MAG: DEAD/DEAH box helicase family protein [Zavarzinella sp.]